MVRVIYLKYFFVIVLFAFFSLCLHGCNNARIRLDDQQTIVVAIASSLSDVMSEIRTEFIGSYPNVNVVFNAASSGILAQQIEQNAPIDIFASADLKIIQELINQQKINPQTNKIFAQNHLVLAAVKNSTLNVESLEELVSDEINKIALGNPKLVPAGNYAKNALRRSPSNQDLYRTLNLQQKLVFTENVRQVLTYVETQSVDAGFIYQTDLQHSQAVSQLLALDSEQTGEISYAIAPIQKTINKTGTQEFIDFVLSPQGQEIIAEYGFWMATD
ncbi:molybdate ABC transporter substrate-binding protein [[Leptolyngbya] sp. PCC 7376]|uniref:molybdate ABC transporter substrate-binding protein n=1 Tax=[Leptolyngbya] sp. PCC 7376 TaxID=111781 RepID=UPI001356F3EA|nr:molybdate ABC transporter substrate-binding protein [[Leptolyngbya] sp. PCC 7376]